MLCSSFLPSVRTQQHAHQICDVELHAGSILAAARTPCQEPELRGARLEKRMLCLTCQSGPGSCQATCRLLHKASGPPELHRPQHQAILICWD